MHCIWFICLQSKSHLSFYLELFQHFHLFSELVDGWWLVIIANKMIQFAHIHTHTHSQHKCIVHILAAFENDDFSRSKLTYNEVNVNVKTTMRSTPQVYIYVSLRHKSATRKLHFKCDMACGLMAKIERYRKQSQESGDWMNEKLPWRTLNAKIRFVHIFQLECIYFAYIYFYCRHLLYSASSSSSFSSSYKAKFMFDNTLIECTQNPFNSRFRPQRKLLRKWKIKMKNENVCVCGVYTYQLFEVLHYG